MLYIKKKTVYVYFHAKDSKKGTYSCLVPTGVQDEFLRLVMPGGHRGVGSRVAWWPEV